MERCWTCLIICPKIRFKDMDALYISPLSSESLINRIAESSGTNPGYAVQKFSRLLIKGLLKNEVKCKALSAIPVNNRISKKLFWTGGTEVENGVAYKYIPFLNLPLLRQICLFVYTFFYVLLWGIRNKSEKFIITDVLNYTICSAAVVASKLTGVRIIGVMTDMPGLMVNAAGSSRNFLSHIKFLKNIGVSSVYKYDAYVFLTEQMNKVINKRNVPYIVMEGFVDSDITAEDTKKRVTDSRTLLYAGGLHERYGLKTLVEAFMRLPDDDLRMKIYGSGPFVKDLRDVYTKKDKRIEFFGVVPNQEVVESEMSATLLINPRPTTEAFTKYSFPSKNMEYMVSGTPVLTTDLPGMPEEYKKYVFVFKDESVEGYRKSLDEALSLNPEDLEKKGSDAKKWILSKKNNKVQTLRIINMIKSLSV